MRKVVIRPFWNVEKEQKWINRMAQNGYALIDYCWIRYVFEPTDPGEYTYQIDLLENKRRSPETEQYLEFLQESDIEVVATYMSWVYLCKKSSAGPFYLYSDKESKLRYLRRLRNFWFAMVFMEIWVAMINMIPVGIDVIREGSPSSATINLGGAILCFLIGVTMLVTCLYPVLTQIKKIKNEMQLFE